MTDWTVALCPGCDNWSLQVASDESLDVVEGILEEHEAECPWLEALATIRREQAQG